MHYISLMHVVRALVVQYTGVSISASYAAMLPCVLPLMALTITQNSRLVVQQLGNCTACCYSDRMDR